MSRAGAKRSKLFLLCNSAYQHHLKVYCQKFGPYGRSYGRAWNQINSNKTSTKFHLFHESTYPYLTMDIYVWISGWSLRIHPLRVAELWVDCGSALWIFPFWLRVSYAALRLNLFFFSPKNIGCSLVILGIVHYVFRRFWVVAVYGAIMGRYG